MLKQIDIPPVYLVLLMLAAKLWADTFPFYTFDHVALNGAGFLVMAAGCVLMAWAAWTMMQAGTPIFPRKMPNLLVTGGPFQFSRNPIYLADAIILAGWIMVLGSAASAVALPLFMGIISFRFIGPEEEALSQAFPKEFEAWRSKVRRWI